MFEKMKRGGISVISHKWAKANNQYLPDYDENAAKSFLLQLDVNNLYGWSMKQKLPVSDFKWVKLCDNTETWIEYIIKPYSSQDSIGYILVADLEYPKSLHDEHNDYLMAPEHMKLGNVNKLVPNLNNKEKYVRMLLSIFMEQSTLKKLTNKTCFVSLEQEIF